MTAIISFAGILTAFIICGCSTLPLPDTPDESLIVFAYDIDGTWQQGNITVSSVDLYLSNADTGENKTVSFQAGDHYKTLALEPGQYTTKKLVVVNQWQNDVNSTWFDTHDYHEFFYLKPRTIYLFAELISLQARQNSDGYDLHHFRVVEKKRDAVLTDLRKDHHWLAWEDYTLYGFRSGSQ